LFCYLSAAGLSVMAAAALPFDNLDHIVAEDQVKLPVERHRD